MKVYVSATQRDLLECRAAVHGATRRLGIEDIAMEAYVAEGRPPLDKCLEDVRRCDLYIGLFAWRYGFIPPGADCSITEMEYREAVRLEKPCLIFLLAEDASWPGNLIDRGADGERILALRRELSGKHVCSFFTGPDDLDAKVTAALANFRHGEQRPRPPDEPTGALSEEVRRAYYDRLSQRYRRIELEALNPTPAADFLRIGLASVFVEPSVRADAPPEIPRTWWQRMQAEGELRAPEAVDPAEVVALRELYQAKPPSPLFDIVTDPSHRAIVLLGDPGAGKSAVTRYLALALAGVHTEPRLAPLADHLPILIELRSYIARVVEGKCANFPDYLDHRYNSDRLGIRKDELLPFLRGGGKALFLFDGLDEIFEPHRREDVVNQIAALLVDFPAVCVLVTSRIIGYRRQTLTDAGFEHFTLDDFDDAQIDRFLSGWYQLVIPDRPDGARAERMRMLGAIRSSAAIRELAGNPLLLTILAIIGHNQQLPKERWRLYDYAADVLISYWDVNRRLREQHGESEPLDTYAKKELLRRLAFQMQSREGGLSGNSIERQQLIRVFEDYLVDRYQYSRGQANAMARTMIDQFRERNFILGRYGPGLYGFVHRTFLEFFCAEAIVKKFQQEGSDWTIERLRELFAQHWAEPSWREVLRLVVGALPAEQAGTLIDLLATEVNRPWPPEEFDHPPWNLALAAQCVAEVREPDAISPAAENVLRQLILLVEHGVSIEDRNTAALTEAEILPAIRVLGTEWPGQLIFLHWYRRRGIHVSWTAGSSFATRVAVMLSAPEECIEDLLDATLGATDDRRARHALVAGLAESAALATAPGGGANQGRRARCRALLTKRARDDNHGAVRIAALQALVAQFATEPATGELLMERAIEDRYAGVRLFAVQTLSARRDNGRGDEGAALRTLLFDRTRNDPDDPVRRAAVEALGRRYADVEVERLLLDRVGTDRDAGVLQAASRALIDRFGVGSQLRDLLVERVHGERYDAVRRAVIRILGESFAGNVRDLLVDRARSDADPGTRAVALQALTRISAASGRSGAESPVKRPEPEGTAGSGTHLRDLLLERLEHDDDASLRLTATRTLVERYGGEPALRAVLAQRACEDADATVRQAAVQALAERNASGQTADILMDRARTDNAAGVRLAATQALAEHFGTDTRTSALILEQAGQERDTIVRLAATRALIRIGADPSIHDRLLDRVARDPDPQIMREAAGALVAWPNHHRRVSRLLSDRARRDSYAGTRLAAVETLVSGFGAEPMAALLLDLAGTDPDPAVFHISVSTLVEELGGSSPTSSPTKQPGGGTRSIKQLLVERAADHDGAIRLVAVKVLGDHFGADPQLRALLVDSARNDKDVQVRRAAIDRLGNRLAAQQGVRALLIELLADPDWSVRRTAVHALGRHFGADEDIRALFIDHAANDPNPDFRRLVGQALTWLPGADPDHLPDPRP